MTTPDAAGFRSFTGRGFHLTFDNGFTVSVMFGRGNYCRNRNTPEASTYPLYSEHASPDAEVAVWGPDGEFVHLPSVGDDVAGWVKPEEVAALLAAVAKLPRPRIGASLDERSATATALGALTLGR